MRGGLPASRMASPADFDIEALSIDQILAPHSDLLDRIKICYGVDQASFERDILTVVRGYAAYVHLLPATANNYFSAPGGLLQLGLEVAFFALQGTDAHIFSGRATISARRHLEPRWRLATFIAGLCCEVHRTLNQLSVSAPAGHKWPSCVTPLSQWLTDARMDRYQLGWQPGAPNCRAAGVFALRLVLPPDVLQHLADGNAVVVPHLLSSISGLPLHGQHNVLDELVRRSAALVIDRHLQARAERSGQPMLGLHLEQYLVDALRRLVASNAAWAANTERSRVWFCADGLFIVWPGAANDIRKLFDADQMPGMPRDPQAMLDALLIAGVAQPMDDGTPLWPITPPGAKTPVDAMKLSSPAIIYAHPVEPPTSLAESLLHPSSGTKTWAGANANPTARAPSATPTLTLDAPMRLDASVRKALEDVIAALNSGSAKVSAVSVPAGLFVPLAEFPDRGVQTSQAMRALADARMLAPGSPAAGPVTHHDVGGQRVAGVVVATRHISGLAASQGRDNSGKGD